MNNGGIDQLDRIEDGKMTKPKCFMLASGRPHLYHSSFCPAALVRERMDF